MTIIEHGSIWRDERGLVRVVAGDHERVLYRRNSTTFMLGLRRFIRDFRDTRTEQCA